MSDAASAPAIGGGLLSTAKFPKHLVHRADTARIGHNLKPIGDNLHLLNPSQPHLLRENAIFHAHENLNRISAQNLAELNNMARLGHVTSADARRAQLEHDDFERQDGELMPRKEGSVLPDMSVLPTAPTSRKRYPTYQFLTKTSSFYTFYGAFSTAPT